MAVVVITPPAPIVTLEEVKNQLGDIPTEDQSYVDGLIAGAMAWIDGPTGWLERSFGVQLLEFTEDNPCSPIVNLPFGPVLEVVEAWSGTDELPVDQYVPGASAIGFGLLLSTGRPFRVRYWAGYGKRDPHDTAKWISEPPASVKVAIMMLVAQWYNTRESAVTGTITSKMPFAVDALLQPFRVYR